MHNTPQFLQYIAIYSVGVNISFRIVPFADRTVLKKKMPSKTIPFYSAGRDAILLLYAIRI